MAKILTDTNVGYQSISALHFWHQLLGVGPKRSLFPVTTRQTVGSRHLCINTRVTSLVTSVQPRSARLTSAQPFLTSRPLVTHQYNGGWGTLDGARIHTVYGRGGYRYYRTVTIQNEKIKKNHQTTHDKIEIK